MPTIVLQDAMGVDLGFLLVAGEESLSDGPAGRDVVLMRLPFPSPSPLATFLENHRQQEFTASVQPTTDGSILTFATDPSSAVRVELGQAGSGTWSAGDVGTGTCKLASAKKK